MNRVMGGAAVVAGVAVGTVRWMQRRGDGNQASADGDAGRWRVVTINKPPDEVAPGAVARAARPARRPGRGADPSRAGGPRHRAVRAPAPGRTLRRRQRRRAGRRHRPAQKVRSALRQSKQLVEVGQVLRVDPQPAGKRHALGKPLELAARRAGGEGVGVMMMMMMKALCWNGVNELAVEEVPDPTILNSEDVILKVTASASCGSDLHLLDGYIPAMLAGDIIGHEFMGEIVEVGPDVRNRRVGDRVVVGSVIACERCWYCEQDLYSNCDDGNPDPALTDALWGGTPAGIFGYSHAMGGFAGSHAQYVRVPYADVGTFPVPDELDDDLAAVYASDGVPTGWQGADMGNVKPGDVVAVWGCGGVGQMAAKAAQLMGADRVIAIDRYPERLAQMSEIIGAETLDYSKTDVLGELRERSGGRGPDVCIEAVGMEAHRSGPQYLYDAIKQQLRLETDRPIALREAILACRKGGTVSVLGVFAGLIDKFPMGAIMNKGLTLVSAQQHGQRYIPMLLERMARGEIPTRHLSTHPMPLEQGPHGYDLFKHKKDGCIRSVFLPNGS